MAVFSIDRGHDGPSRTGTLELNTKKVSTPALVSQTTDSTDYSYQTHPRDKISSSHPILLSLGSTLMWNLESIQDIPEHSMVLLPSIPGFPDISEDSSLSTLQYQLDFISNIDESIDVSRLVVRFPSKVQKKSLQDIIELFSQNGIVSAAFSFDGISGPKDFENILTRSFLPRNWTTHALGRVPPNMLPLLYYTGFDFFDIGYAWASSSQHNRLWSQSQEKISTDTPKRFCSCEACTSSHQNPLDKESILQHNILLYKTVLSEAVYNHSRGTLRQLVEAYTHSNPSINSLLRLIDQSLYPYLEEFTPTTYSVTQDLIGPESYHAPAIERYRSRLAERYIPPEFKKIVLLLPCSARKPYSDSKSHKRFISVLDSTLGHLRSNISETILTSPLGVIPRELERIFPPANYDIPVSGDWDHEEIEIGSQALIQHLNKYAEDVVVIAHVSGGYRSIVETALDGIKQSAVFTIDEESPTSRDGLSNLSEVLVEMKDVLDLSPVRSDLKLETLQATADFQFGAGAGKLLFSADNKITGKLYRMVVARDGSKQLAAYLATNGMLSLTIDGGEKLLEMESYLVRFAGKQVQGGSLFAIGVNDADDQIRPGDEVLIVDDSNKLLAVGRSEMSGREMVEHNRGRAVSIRHKVGE